MPSNSAEKAKRIFQEQKAHCAQAIFSAYGEQLNEGKVDFDTCMKIASAFCGGIANTGNICGALSGALMAIGLKYGGDTMNEDATMEESMNVIKIGRKLLDEFKSLNGSIMCRELIKHDLLTDENLMQAMEKGCFDNCPKFVEDVTMILDKLL